MNKDLDERLVPKGEYRDAQNIQISTSEGSDIGAIEAMLGNTKIANAPGSQTWADNFGLISPKVIGAARDTQNNKIYWFITSSASDVDAILEYDEASDEISPVIVDARAGGDDPDPVLNFNVNYLITGINIIDGMLFWTDDLNEPRKINIETFKAGSTANTTSLNATTQVYRPYDNSTPPVLQTRFFIEDDITVIRKAPDQALTVTAYPSIYTGAGTGITPVTLTHNFYNVAVNDTPTVTFDQSINWSGNTNTDFIISGYIDNEDGSRDNYEIRGEINDYTNAPSVDILINSISKDIPNQAIDWELLLVEDDPIFKNDFPRFTYRYKFIDGEYSPFAPFSKAAFVPGEFEYLSRDGNNIGMESVIRKISLTNLAARPSDVDEVELLYKGARSTNVYLIDSFKHDNTEIVQTLSLPDITSGTLGRVIDSAQLLRLYDNVPKKAKAQEIIGNRIVYGNYLENYDIDNSFINITAGSTAGTHAAGNFGEESVKSDREYQIGVTFIDDYGRESPVFTSTGGAVTINSDKSSNSNSLFARLSDFSVPAGISKFKYYVKDPSSEYYNIALDRYYEAEDSGVWLSFPSSERNKVQEGQFLRLKKQHDASVAVNDNNKYKITNISNEAPEHLLERKVAQSKAAIQIDSAATYSFIRVGRNKVKFYGPSPDVIDDGTNLTVSNKNFSDNIKKGNYISFAQDFQSTSPGSAIYEIVSGGHIGDSVVLSNSSGSTSEYFIYEITLKEKIKPRDIWLESIGSNQIFGAIIYEPEIRRSPEFVGRFFTKINPNAAFFDNVKSAFNDLTIDFIQSSIIDVAATLDGTLTSSDFAVGWEDTLDPDTGTTFLLPSIGSDNFRLAVARTEDLSDDYPGGNQNGTLNNDLTNDFYNNLVVGATIKFVYSDNTVSSDYYTITNLNTTSPASLGGYNRTGSNGSGRNTEYTLNRNFDDSQPVTLPTSNLINIIGIALYEEDLIGADNLLSSTNPAVFETEPLELADLDLYYEATDAIDLGTNNANLTTNQTLNFFNTYSFGNGVESNRIRDDFNAPIIGNGVRVSSIIEEPYKEERRGSGMIFSGIINSRSGINESNQFLMAQDITKDLNPIHGTIQKLSARGAAARGDLIALCEDKVFKILANKDALFNADGNTNLTATKNVLGQAIPFAGEYGISTQPESFASYGFRSYFCDRNRGAVLRLSADGLTVISDKGLKDYFRDSWAAQLNKKVFGSYDEYTDAYHARVQNQQVLFNESVNGWVTRVSWLPDYSGISLNNNYYTFKNGELYIHNNAIRNNIYGTQQSATVTAVLNDAPTAIKNFKTLEYQGDAGWTATLNTDQEKGLANLANFVKREGLYQTYIQGVENTWNETLQSGDIDFYSLSILGIGEHSGANVTTIAGNNTFEFTIDIDPAISIGDKLYFQDGNNIVNLGDITAINRSSSPKTIVSNIQQLPGGGASIVNTGEFIFAAKDKRVNTSGIIGYYADVTFTNTSSDKSELFGIGSEVFISSE